MAFFQIVRFIFQISKSSKENIPTFYPELEIWNIFLLEIWRPKKRIALSKKKPPLVACTSLQSLKEIIKSSDLENLEFVVGSYELITFHDFCLCLSFPLSILEATSATEITFLCALKFSSQILNSARPPALTKNFLSFV